MDTAQYSDIVGVFRERTNAEQAAEALKQAGMSEIELTVYDPPTAEVADQSSLVETKNRILVHVKAEGREQEAVDILTQHGSNNADLPPDTMLEHGSIVSSIGNTSENTTNPPAQGALPETFYETPKASGQQAEAVMMDKPSTP